MYSRAKIIKAINLYNEIHSITRVINTLGYPTKKALERWVKLYKTVDDLDHAIQHLGRNLKYSDQQRDFVLSVYKKNGFNARRTLLELGYPSPGLLRQWIHEAYPEQRRKTTPRISPAPTSLQTKIRAVRELKKRNQSAQSIAKKFNISRVTLYRWTKEDICVGGSIAMTKSKRTQGKTRIRTNQTEQSNNPSQSINQTQNPITTQEQLDQAFKEKLAQLEELNKKVNALTIESELLNKDVRQIRMERDALMEVAKILKKDAGFNYQTNLSNSEKTQVIKALRSDYSLKDLLALFHLSKSSYCYQQVRLKCDDKYTELRKKLHQYFDDAFGTYGYRRLWMQLRRNGTIVSEKVIRRLMKEERLRVYVKTRKKYSSYLGEITPAVPNLVNRDFHASKPNQIWLTDITEFHLPAGKVYLSPIIDCYDGMPVAWSIGTSPTADLANSMLTRAVSVLREEDKPIIHSDRGSHYRWPEWIKITQKFGLIRSMSKKGCSPDNAACEGFFGRLKNEMFYNHSWRGVSINTFIQILGTYLDWYANKRIKISLGGLSPKEFRQKNQFNLV